MKKRILVRLDANSHIGLGHAVRTANLLKQLPYFDLWISGNGDAIQNFFPTAQILEEINTIENLNKKVDEIDVHGLIIDHPGMASEVQKLREISSKPVVLIDDYGNIPSGNLVINGTILPEYHQYDIVDSGDRILTGGRYALIHPAFEQKSDTSLRSKNCLLIVIGSGDHSYKWLDFLLETKPFIKWQNIIIVTGSAHPYPVKVTEACNRLGLQHCHAISSLELSQYAHKSTAALTTGGMIVYEALAAGLPLISFPQIDNLINELKFFSDQGALINLGTEYGFDDQYIYLCLERLRNDISERTRLQSAGPSLVDGSGINRGASAISELFGFDRRFIQ